MGDRRHRFVYTNVTYRETSGNARMEVLSMSTDYKRHAELQDRERTKELLKELPPFCTEYYKGRNLKLSAKTQYNYAFKMSVFLRYLHESNSYFGSKEIWDITLDDLDHLNRDDIEDFMEWLSGQKTGRNRGAATNSSSTVDNYLSCLSTYWRYFVSKEKLSKNPFIGIDRNVARKKNIIFLEADERDEMLEAAWGGDQLSERQRKIRDKSNSAIRDATILMVLFDTGIRVSELVGLDLDDIDFKHHSLKVVRKGNKEDSVNFSDATEELLKGYLEERKTYQPVDDEYALFLVSIGKYKGERISVRSVEKLVKKYAMASGVPNASKISPHKLRSSYAMAMLDATSNISLVQKQLGHQFIGTTSKYAEARNRDKETYRNAIFHNEAT